MISSQPTIGSTRSQDDASTKATTSPLTPSSTDPRSFAPLISSTPSDASLPQPGSAKVSAPPLETQRSASRFFPNPLNQDAPAPSQKQTSISAQSPTPEYNPPQTSRLLGLSSRTSSTSGSVKHQNVVENLIAAPQHHSQQPGTLQPDLGSRQSPDTQYRLRPDSALGLGRPEVTRQRDQSPFDQVHRGQFDDKDLYVQQFESQRRASGMSSVSSEGSYGDVGFIGNGGGNGIDPVSGAPNGPNYSSGKGSRFAKFFDNKGGREPQMVAGKPMLAGLTSPSPTQGHRPDNRVPSDSQGDPRTMDDIFAMLQNSANQVSYNPVFGPRTFADTCGTGATWWWSIQPGQSAVHAFATTTRELVRTEHPSPTSFAPEQPVGCAVRQSFRGQKFRSRWDGSWLALRRAAQ